MKRFKFIQSSALVVLLALCIAVVAWAGREQPKPVIKQPVSPASPAVKDKKTPETEQQSSPPPPPAEITSKGGKRIKLPVQPLQIPPPSGGPDLALEEDAAKIAPLKGIPRRTFNNCLRVIFLLLTI